MNEDCSHAQTREKEGETWTDKNGKPHTVIFVKCSYCSKTLRVKQTGDDVPHTYMPPFPMVPGVKP